MAKVRSDYAGSLEARQGKMKNSCFNVSSLLKKIPTSLRKDSACRQSTIEKDMADIEQSPQLLGLSEFAFFQLAHSQWFGRELPERAMERIFADYPFKNSIPFWVRHLGRSVLSRQFQGALALREIWTPDPDQSTATPGMTVVSLVFYPDPAISP
ncbi:MAG: hypothetical protein JSU90_04425 [Nitrospiraceae bacterium]|nr:MAG: hypothetical protein JSU90_04425 [Nitrospiraceae bacterium]